eukprot:Nitzschia sp. Nitz4//scaffold329_size19327//8787//9693//NITZ4_008728-RA/size19327-exonerate_est2genome-gene-0.8-mRNA-1//-1//CDS//3329547996//7091//frame0
MARTENTGRCTPKDLIVFVSENDDTNDTVIIHLSIDMTVDLLSNCISQACVASSVHLSTPVVGLFQGRCFYSLQHILNTIQDDSCTQSSVSYSLFPPPAGCPTKSSDSSSTCSAILLLGPVLVGFYLVQLSYGEYYYSSFLPQTILSWLQQLRKTVWIHPIQELYLQGPAPFGWEGLPTREICSRLSHFGGVDFWSRHDEECMTLIEQRQEILGKRLGIPLLLLVGVWFLLWMIQRIVRWLRKKDDVDPRMVEVYHAVQTILQVTRNENRSMKKKR